MILEHIEKHEISPIRKILRAAWMVSNTMQLLSKNIVRVRRNLYSDSYVGGLVTDRRADGGAGTTLGADAMLRFAKNYIIEAQLVASRTREPEDPALTEGIADLEFGYGAEPATCVWRGRRSSGASASITVMPHPRSGRTTGSRRATTSVA